MAIYVDTKASTTKLKELDKKNSKGTLQGILNFLHKGIGGAEPMNIRVSLGGVKASGTLTFASVIATDIFSINGVSFTCVASGATGNQFNVGGSDALTAAAAAAAVNASATALVKDVVVASADGGVLTITAKHPGLTGNAIAIATADATITVSGARLTGGLDGDTETLNLGKAVS
jgi:hypothetical protein